MTNDASKPRANGEEALHLLTGLARGRFGKIDPARLAQHLMHATPDASWDVRRAALAALSRRYNFAKRDGLRVVARPGRGSLGDYRTGTQPKGRRSSNNGTASRGAGGYRTSLYSIEPLRMSCACADFVRSSLGLCKHALTVLEALEVAKGLRGDHTLPKGNVRLLSWDPGWPLMGSADRLQRLCITHVDRQLSRYMPKGSPDARVLKAPRRRMELIAAAREAIKKGRVADDAAVTTLLDEESQRAERELRARDIGQRTGSALRTLKRKLYAYQREGVTQFFNTGRMLLADDMGLGKTTQAIAIAHVLMHEKAVRRGVLIVPTSLKGQWIREWQETTDVPIELVEGAPSERAQRYAAHKFGFLVIGYEQLLRDLQHVQALAPELVVLDEAQRIKNWATKSAMSVKSLTPTYRLVLTGTPMENRLDELASLMDFVDDLALQPKWRLAPFHTLSLGDGAQGVSGVTHLSELRARLAPSMVRRVRKEVLSQLPSRTDTRVPVELSPQQRDAHDDLKRPLAALLTIAAKRPLTQPEFLRLMQLMTTQRMICNGLAQLHFDAMWPICLANPPSDTVLESLFAPKLAALRGVIEQVVIEQRRTVVVFSQWRNMLRLAHWAISDLLQQASMRAVFFTGAESTKLRERAIVELHDDPTVTVMFLSDAGGVGLNLQRAATCCINLEMPWNPAVLEQRIGRIHRLGQTAPIDVYNLVCEEGIEARVATLVAQKKAVFSSLFDGTTDEVIFDGQSTFMDGVRTLVDVEPATAAADATVVDLDDVDSDDTDALDEPTTITDTRVLEHAAPEAIIPPAPNGSSSTPASGLRIDRLPDGALRIDVPPELAAPLAALLETLARGLRA